MKQKSRSFLLLMVIAILFSVGNISAGPTTAPPREDGYTAGNRINLSMVYSLERFGEGEGLMQISVPLGQNMGYYGYLSDDAPEGTMTTNDQWGNLGLLLPVNGSARSSLTISLYLQQMQYRLNSGSATLQDPRAFAPWLVVDHQLPQLMPKARAVTAAETGDAGRASRLYELTLQSFASGLFDLGDGPEDMGRLFLSLCRLFGIPARTVYGYRFTPAEINRYAVSTIVPGNLDSWVEAYIEGIGWVPTDFGSSSAAFGNLGVYLLPLSIEDQGLVFQMFSGAGTIMISRALERNDISFSAATLPVALISFNERDGYALTGALGLNGDLSYDPAGLTLTESDWDRMHTQLEVGETTVRLRVRNSQGTWSRWACRLLNVIDRSSIPVATINLNAVPPYTASSNFSYITGSGYSSQEGISVVDMQWANRRDFYPDGKHRLGLRVQDERGVWSDWVYQELLIGDGIQKPVAIISYTPEGEHTSATQFTWQWDNSFDPDGQILVGHQWENNLASYPIGVHTVRLRVQNASGKWSDWASREITIQSNVPAVAPKAVIGLRPERRDFVLPESFELLNLSYDLNGDLLINEEWQGRMESYNTPGTYSVRLRVQNSRGLWSDWDMVTFNVHPAGTTINPDGSTTPPGSTWTPPPPGPTPGVELPPGGGIDTPSGGDSGEPGSSGGPAVTPEVRPPQGPNYREDGSANRAPIARIQVFPGTTITPTTQVTLVGSAYDPDWDAIT
ncbi:MAG: transglutaminase-like domain-containing protein, partial [Symbiobacteriaceae bacterium]|nr:transglutaminase-like domain-containing protein [Symbiobacteriaceae bacterium]